MGKGRWMDVTQKVMITVMPGCRQQERNVEIDRIISLKRGKSNTIK